MPGVKELKQKIRLDLLPVRALIGIAQAFQDGVERGKYPPWDWLQQEDWSDTYYAATLRHLLDWRMGKAKDEKSGLHPLFHAGANIMILIVRSLEKCPSKI